MSIIKQFFYVFIILLLVILLFAERCSKPSPQKPEIRRDTVWMKHDSIIYVKPQLIESIPFDKLEIKYLPDTNYVKLLKQYNELLREFLVKNIQRDSLKIDSIGYVTIKDTVSKNFIQGRQYSYSLKYPVITNTITLPPKNQLYIGGSLGGNPSNFINEISVGVMLKNKKDQLYGIHTGVDFNGNTNYSLSTYWKIKLRK